MPQTVQIQDEYLHPGDMVYVEYLIKPGTPDGMVALAIREAKAQLATDARFHYQGFSEDVRVNKSGLTGAITEDRYIILAVQVADPRKVTGSYDPDPEVQKAGWQGVVLLSAIAALGAGMLVAYATHVTFATVTVRHATAVLQKETTQAVLDSDLSPEQKTAVLTGQAEAMAQAGSKQSIGSGIAAAGGSLVTAGIIIGVLFVVFGSPWRSGGGE